MRHLGRLAALVLMLSLSCRVDGDGHDDRACGGDDCNDSAPEVIPGAPDPCGDGIDQDGDGADEAC